MRVVEISYTPIPEEFETDLVERVRHVSEPYGNQFRGMPGACCCGIQESGEELGHF